MSVGSKKVSITRFDFSAVAVGFVGVCLALAFVVPRAASQGVDQFVGAGTTYASSASIQVNPGDGYDGQFYFRLAQAPFSTAEQVAGVSFDSAPYRQQRIGYPVLAFLVGSVPGVTTALALVAVNVSAVGMLAFLGGRLAQFFGRSPVWGLALLAWPGFLFSLAFDLAEILAAVCALGAALQLLRNAHVPAAVLLSAGVLVRETVVILAAALLIRTRRWVYAAPFAVLALWQSVVWVMWGTLPALASQIDPDRGQLGAPLVGLAEGIPHWSLIDSAIFAALLALVWSIRRQIHIATPLGLATIAYGFLALILARPVWESWRGWSRVLVELVVLLFIARVGVGRQPASDQIEQADVVGSRSQGEGG